MEHKNGKSSVYYLMLCKLKVETHSFGIFKDNVQKTLL